MGLHDARCPGPRRWVGRRLCPEVQGRQPIWPGLLAHLPARRLAAFPKWVLPSLWLKVKVLFLRGVPLLEGVWSEGKTRPLRGARFPEMNCWFLSWPEVLWQWSVLWIPHSRHEPYGQQYPGQGPASGQPPYGGHQPGLYPQQPVSRRAGMHLWAFCLKPQLVLLLQSFRKYKKNE